MSRLQKILGKGLVLALMGAYVLVCSGCIVVPYGYGHPGHRAYPGYWYHHDGRDRD